ncbi:N,N-dimethylformamidase beta subunit family domain-containing protein [Bacillus sp. JJ1521]|uniref:N,N-dimethylformamidase beta subunit family domain-containing protein n=1 Tax=Bacillus sp. JJ1521 TaxID=3122957 RepID=UPI002FFD674E
MKKISTILLFLLLILATNSVEANAEEGVERFAGKDRFEVAVNISKKGWSAGANTVILANYLAFADALAATPLAYQENGPILLTHPNKLTDTTKAELKRLNPQKVILVGGPGSIHNQVITDLQSMNIKNVERIGGIDRYEVAKQVASRLPNTGKAVIAYGLNYPDALAIAPYAARNGYPILLTKKDNLPQFTKDSLNSKQIKSTIIVGGEGSVGKNVANSLPGPYRIGGKDRYEVAANIDNTYNKEIGNVFIATGASFADALTGSVLAAKETASLLLTYKDKLPQPTENAMLRKPNLNITILGGTGSVGSNMYIPGVWTIKKPGKNTLQGYTSKTSYIPGESIAFYIKSPSSYQLEFYRMGYNNGKGAQHLTTISGRGASIQNSKSDPNTMDANWTQSYQYQIPSNWSSGFYLVKIVSNDKMESYIPFVIKDRQPNADFAVLISTNTYQAYNNWGGKSLYGYNSSNKIPAIKISYNRPYNEENGAGQFFSYEYNLIRWMEKKGYNLNYVTDTDIHQGYLANANIKSLIVAGHGEYWSKQMRDHIENKHMNGNMDIGVFSANVGYWQVRYENNDRLLVSYKDRANEDPFNLTDPSQVTAMFRQAPVNRPESELFGVMYQGIPSRTMPFVVTNSSHWIYNGTTLKNGDQIPSVVGGEIDRYDSAIPGVEVIGHSPVVLYGNNSFANVVWVEKPSGSKVFAVGTFYWNWFLDPYGHETQSSYNPNLEKMTENVLNKFIN